MTFKLLLFDLDGTLLTPERAILPQNLEKLRELMDRGIMVSLATGRSPRCTAPHADKLRPNAPIIHFNGAMVRWWESGEVLFHRHLRREDALAALEVGAGHGLHVNLYVDDTIYIAERTPVSEESERKDNAPHTVVGDLVPFVEQLERPVTKLLFIGPQELHDRFREQAASALSSPCAIVNSEVGYFEVLPPGVDKGSAAVELARSLGLSLDEIVAFGDDQNDIELLSNCGLGVAMGNSHEALEDYADVVIGNNDTDAITCFLDELLG